jgi:hypothetical protein
VALFPGQGVHVVPQRFGLTSIFGLTTLMAILFGSLRQVDAHPGVYFSLSVTTLVVCVVQMFHIRWPRSVSALAGAAAMPICFIISIELWPSRYVYMMGWDAVLLWGSLFFIPAGAFVGYLSGACLAGIFLIQDLFEGYFLSRQRLLSS